MGTTLSGVEWQFAMYATGLPEAHRKRAVVVGGRLPFVFEASGSETHFTNGLDPDPRARRTFSFPKPATLARILRDASADPQDPTWRTKVSNGNEVPGTDDPQLDDYLPDAPVTVSYTRGMPPETFDLVDRRRGTPLYLGCGVVEYFDAHAVGLTATPGKQTFAFFGQDSVSSYAYPHSMSDGVALEQAAVGTNGSIDPEVVDESQ